MDDEKLNTNMTEGDVMAELERTLPQLDTTPKPLYGTKTRLLAPKHRVIAVSGKTISDNVYRAKFEQYASVIEIWDVPEGGDFKEATFIGNARHVEILGPSWIHHDPQNSLGYENRRSSVLATKSAIRLYEDTPEQAAVSAAAKYGC